MIKFSPKYLALPIAFFSFDAALADINGAADLVRRDLSFSAETDVEQVGRVTVEVTTEVDVDSCELQISERTSIDGELKTIELTKIPIAGIDIGRLDDAPNHLLSMHPEPGGGVFFHGSERRFSREKTGVGVPPSLHEMLIRSLTYQECSEQTCSSREEILFDFLWPSYDISSAKSAITELHTYCSKS